MHKGLFGCRHTGREVIFESLSYKISFMVGVFIFKVLKINYLKLFIFYCPFWSGKKTGRNNGLFSGN
jgi:hypothetical protein